METKSELKGLENATKIMDELGKLSHARQAANKGLTKATKILKNQAVQNAKIVDDPESDEQIWKNIKSKTVKTRKKTNVRHRVGVDGSRKFFAMHKNMVRGKAGMKQKVRNPNYGQLKPGATPYWHFVELGTAHSIAIPFMQPAMVKSRRPMEKVFAEQFMASAKEKIRKLKETAK